MLEMNIFVKWAESLYDHPKFYTHLNLFDVFNIY